MLDFTHMWNLKSTDGQKRSRDTEAWNKLMILRGKVGVGGWLGRDEPKTLYACMQNPWTQAIVWWRPGYICLCFSINSIIFKYFTGDMSICHGYSTVNYVKDSDIVQSDLMRLLAYEIT